MASFLPDTTCIIALVCGWHPDHSQSSTEFSRRLSRGEELVVAAPALVEAYAVLTRLPPPYRIAPLTPFSFSSQILWVIGGWFRFLRGRMNLCYANRPDVELWVDKSTTQLSQNVLCRLGSMHS